MSYGIYVTWSNSNIGFNHPTCGWLRDRSFKSLCDAKKCLLKVADTLNDDFWDWHFVNSHTLVASRTDTLPYPTTEHIMYHIEKR